MKQKMNQLFKDKLILVMLVLGLLTIVSAAGVMTIQKGRSEESPYLNMEGEPDHLADEDGENSLRAAGDSQAGKAGSGGGQELAGAAGAEDGAAGSGGEDSGRELAAGNEDSQNGGAGGADGRNGAGNGSGQDGAAGTGAGQSGQAAPDSAQEEAAMVGLGQDDAASLALNFAETQSMMWPVEGNVLLDYSMDTTIYFPTLEQYKCNPGMVIQSDVSQPVSAPADSRVLEAGTNEEIGNYLVLDLGDGYTVTCGQMKEVQAVAGEYLEKGQVLGYVAEPTKYYTLEGPNIYLELEKDGAAVDPLDYLE